MLLAAIVSDHPFQIPEQYCRGKTLFDMGEETVPQDLCTGHRLIITERDDSVTRIKIPNHTEHQIGGQNMVTEWQERLLLQDIMDGLAAAIRDAESEGRDVDIDQLDSIKLNKLAYLAVNEFNVPVTYSWYLYGASLSDSDVNVGYAIDAYESEIGTDYEPSIGDEPWEQPGESPLTYKEFFLRDVDLENIFRDKTKSYLEDFYSDYAPDKYEELYVACAIFQKSLDAIGENRGVGTERQQIETALDELNGLVEEVVFHEEFDEEVVEAFTLYTDLLKDVLVTLPEIEEWTAYKRRTVYDVCSFFYNKAWKYVALRISEDMVEEINGPSWRSLLSGILDDVDEVSSTYEEDFRGIEQRCYESEIVAQEFRRYTLDAETEEDYSERAEEDLEIVEEWEPASQEANEHLDE